METKIKIIINRYHVIWTRILRLVQWLEVKWNNYKTSISSSKFFLNYLASNLFSYSALLKQKQAWRPWLQEKISNSVLEFKSMETFSLSLNNDVHSTKNSFGHLDNPIHLAFDYHTCVLYLHIDNTIMLLSSLHAVGYFREKSAWNY